MNTEKKLRITSVSEELLSNDERNYRVVGFMQAREDNVLINDKERRRTLWAEGPNGSAGDSIYPKLAGIKEKLEQGHQGPLVLGSIETVEVEDFYIPSEYGKYPDPETGEAANKASTYTSVVFSNENIKNIARSQNLTIKGESQPEETSTMQEALEEPEEVVA